VLAIVLESHSDIQIQDIRVWGDKEDKEELYRRLRKDKNIGIRLSLAEIVDPPLIFTITFGLISTLKIIHDFLKERKTKNIEVQISHRDGRVTTIKSTNPDELQVLIQELVEEK
jgi:hypothetical protein